MSATLPDRLGVLARLRLVTALGIEAQPWIMAIVLAFPVGLVAFLVVGIVVLVGAVPTGPARVLDGEVVGFGLRESEYGSLPYARVRLKSGREVTVPIARGQDCAVGDHLRIRQTPVRWGRRHVAAPEGCTR